MWLVFNLFVWMELSNVENKDNEVDDADNDSGGGCVNVDDDAHDDNDDDVITLCRQAW